MPNYYILVKNPDETRLYFGALEASGSAMTFPQLLQKYYGGDLGTLLLTVTWGGKDERDSDIIEDLVPNTAPTGMIYAMVQILTFLPFEIVNGVLTKSFRRMTCLTHM